MSSAAAPGTSGTAEGMAEEEEYDEGSKRPRFRAQCCPDARDACLAPTPSPLPSVPNPFPLCLALAISTCPRGHDAQEVLKRALAQGRKL